MITDAVPTTVASVFPASGPCGLCGGPDARHRMWDSIAGRIEAGEPTREVADDYELPFPVVDTIARRWRPEAQGWVTP